MGVARRDRRCARGAPRHCLVTCHCRFRRTSHAVALSCGHDGRVRSLDDVTADGRVRRRGGYGGGHPHRVELEMGGQRPALSAPVSCVAPGRPLCGVIWSDASDKTSGLRHRRGPILRRQADSGDRQTHVRVTRSSCRRPAIVFAAIPLAHRRCPLCTTSH